MKLHLLNGDSTLHQFRKTTITGDTIVWREILCEGKTLVNLSDDNFWLTREAFLKQFVEEFNPEEYAALKRTFQDINLSKYEEIILWFEYDLFCQINLLAVLSWLQIKTKNTTIKVSLVCVGKHPNHSKLVALGNLTLAEFAALYPSRKELNTIDITYASQIWTIYCSNKHDQLLPAIQQHKTTAFQYLESAMYQHQKRFPAIQNGLTDIELRILELLLKTPSTQKKLVNTLLKTQEVYGFGDLQYFKVVEDLRPLLKEAADILSVNQLGKKVLANRANFKEWRTNFYNYGGTNIGDFRWDARRDELSLE